MQVWSLASGSSGNSYLLRARDTALLVDCGLPLRVLTERLANLGLAPEQLDAVLVTHEHTDHVGGVPTLARRHRVPLYATAGTFAAVEDRLPKQAVCHRVRDGVPLQIGEFAVQPFAVPHDANEPVAYHVSTPRARVCILTDLGHVPERLLPRLQECELLVLEFNHDAQQLAHGPYHPRLKQRIASAVGHLSNADAGNCLASAVRPSHEAVWLAHLSEVNNSRRHAAEAAGAAVRRGGRADLPVRIAERRALSLHWDLDGPRQLRLF